MTYYTVHILNADIVRPRSELRAVVAHALEPLVREAGLLLNLVEIPQGRDEQHMPDVSVSLSRDLRGLGPSNRVLAEQSGAVLVGAILQMRVDSWVSRSRTEPGYSPNTTHSANIRALWTQGEPKFARTVGNIVVHELGHTIAGLEHHMDPGNFMFTGASIAHELGTGFRTYANLRRLWSGPHHFTADQARRMVSAIRARQLRGFEVEALRYAP